jgi:signal transduction histidine kinase
VNSVEIFWAVVIVTGIVIVLVIASGLLFVKLGMIKANQVVELTRTRLEFEKELRKTETEVTEQLLSHYSRELHDSVGQLLTSMNLQLRRMKQQASPAPIEWTHLEGYIKDATSQVKSLSRSLNNEYTSKIGLIQSLEFEIERLKTLEKFDIHWSCNGTITHLSQNQELMVLRIFQEVSQNALRHSGARNFHVHVNLPADDFQMEIMDDGIGFSTEAISKNGKSHGLTNIVKRAKMAELNCEIVSSPGNGTQLRLTKKEI